MGIKWDPTINLGTLLVAIPIIVLLFKMYGDWRVLISRVDILWKEYLDRHGIDPAHVVPVHTNKRRRYEDTFSN